MKGNDCVFLIKHTQYKWKHMQKIRQDCFEVYVNHFSYGAGPAELKS